MSKILLVEDDVNLREIYAARLTAEGYKVVVAADGEEALASAVKEEPDLILLDIMMPKISGFDVLDIIRTTPETKHTKVIMLTALSQESDRERGEKLGADHYLVKSQITLEDVVNTVNETIQAPPKLNPNEAPGAEGLNKYTQAEKATSQPDTPPATSETISTPTETPNPAAEPAPINKSPAEPSPDEFAPPAEASN